MKIKIDKRLFSTIIFCLILILPFLLGIIYLVSGCFCFSLEGPKCPEESGSCKAVGSLTVISAAIILLPMAILLFTFKADGNPTMILILAMLLEIGWIILNVKLIRMLVNRILK